MQNTAQTPPADILIVEDEGIIAADLAACLEDLGYRVTGEAATGEDALRQAAARRPDLVLMDIKLAGEMDGITAAARLREEQDIPAIFLTSHADDATLQRARESQPFGYLIKPFAERELRAAIETSIFRHQVECRLRQLEKERRRAERRRHEAEKQVTIGTLASGVAHDFNNALAGIGGNAMLCQLKLPDDSPVQPFLQTIESIAMRAANLCQQMLAYAGEGRFHVAPVDLGSLVRDIMDLPQAGASPQATVALDLAADLPPVRGDREQLRQIVRNLLVNAYEAIGEKPGKIWISAGVTHADCATFTSAVHAPDLPGGDYVFLEIADSGCGMSREILPRIFDPFFSTKFTGRGLGLAAVLGVVRSHGGAVFVDSTPDGGTTFRLLFSPEDGLPGNSGRSLR